MLKFACAWLSGQRKLTVKGWFSLMQKKMQKVETDELKNRMNSGSTKKFDSAPGHQTHFCTLSASLQKALCFQ